MTEDVVENCLKYSVIIPSYNSEKTIVACLESILAQDINEPYEVIVVDSSSDATPELVRERFPSVRLEHFERRVGSGTARNIGVEMARASHLLAFLDSDCVVQPDWLRQMVAAHESDYAAVGGPVLNGNPESLVSWAGYVSEFRDFLPLGRPRQIEHIPTCNASYKRSVFTQQGGFPDEHYPQEDLLYNWQLRQQGEDFLFDPSIRVAHHHRTKLKEYLTHQNRIGQVTACVLKKTNLPGSFIAKKPVVAFFAIPWLPLVKFIRTLLVFFRWRPSAILKRPLLLPLFLLGLFYWAVGFAQAVYSKESGIG